MLLSHGTKSKNNWKIYYLEIYLPIQLKQLSVIFNLNHINNSLIMQKLYLTVPLMNKLLQLLIPHATFLFTARICCLLIVKQWHFISIITPCTLFLKTFNKKTKLVLYWIILKGNTSMFGSAIQVLPSHNREYLSSFFNPVCCVVVFIFNFIFENCFLAL